MRLFHRFSVAFALLSIASTASLGFELRQTLRRDESNRFAADVKTACESVTQEVRRQAESDHKLIASACQSGELVDRALTWIENGDIDAQRMSIASALVPNTRAAFDLDELMLVATPAEVLGADPRALLGAAPAVIEALLRPLPHRFVLRMATPSTPLAIVTRCQSAHAGRTAGLIGARHVVPLLARLGATLQVEVSVGTASRASAEVAEAVCLLSDGTENIILTVRKRKDALYETWAHIDQTILIAAGGSTLLALVLAFLLARNLSRPIVDLAVEARKVAIDQARPLRVRGSGEIADLVHAFARMLEDLATTRNRLAAASRVAAWQEVARRVAHEVKNPLAPIRAAIETLRRLRARSDPAFDEYFDEATRTVLDEVHRIAAIVTEFTRFARLPAPRPQLIDLAEVAGHVVRLQRANAGSVRVDLNVQGKNTRVNADRDQIVQVITNLVQNAVDAVKEQRAGRVEVTVGEGRNWAVEIVVEDNGAGVDEEMTGRLFEPYATTKAHGTGLGLAIAQRIALEHNGELVYVTPAGPQAGAAFRLTLPVAGPSSRGDGAQPIT